MTADAASLFPCLCSVVPATIHRMLRGSLCPPHYFDVADQENSCIERESPVDRVKARIRKEAPCSVLQRPVSRASLTQASLTKA